MRLVTQFIGLGLIGGLILQPTLGHAQSLILLKPTAPWSVTGQDDVQQIKKLTAGVGWEFEPNTNTAARLKAIGIQTIRCINVDPLPGSFDADGEFIVGKPTRLLAHLTTCRAIGANPHVIIAVGLTPELRLTAEDIPEAQRGILGNLTSKRVYGPKDWGKFRKYCEAYFHYILIDQKFPNARFEVANEPDIGASVFPRPPKPAPGSRAAYEAYFDLYQNVARAASQFESDHPGVRVALGGPALAWAFTFRFGAFNWAERFLRDCAAQNVKLDFLGLHYYGNVSSLDGEYPSTYPSFTEMFKDTQAARDRHCPGLPIWFTEWGASYHVNTTEASMVNANHIGAAWSASFLNTMLECGVDGALYLVTTDLRRKATDGKWEDVWGWASLFVNPVIFDQAHPKAPYHVFEMISRLEGSRVEATRGSAFVNGFASADQEQKRITLMVWNYGARIPEFRPAVDHANREAVVVRVRDATAFFGTKQIHVKRWLVSENVSNARHLFEREGSVDDRAELQQVDEGNYAIIDGLADIGFAAPPSSVSFLELSAPPEPDQ